MRVFSFFVLIMPFVIFIGSWLDMVFIGGYAFWNYVFASFIEYCMFLLGMIVQSRFGHIE